MRAVGLTPGPPVDHQPSLCRRRAPRGPRFDRYPSVDDVIPGPPGASRREAARAEEAARPAVPSWTTGAGGWSIIDRRRPVESWTTGAGGGSIIDRRRPVESWTTGAGAEQEPRRRVDHRSSTVAAPWKASVQQGPQAQLNKDELDY